jgi:hypothetical protein
MSGVFQNTDPPAPHRPVSVRGEDTLAGWRGGWGVNILEDARHSSLYIRVCKYFVLIPINVHESMLYFLYAAGTKNNTSRSRLPYKSPNFALCRVGVSPLGTEETWTK